MYDSVLQSWFDGSKCEESYRKMIRKLNGDNRVEQAKWMFQISPNAPMQFSEQIQYAWPDVLDKAAEWEDRYPQYPDLQWSLARAEKTFGDLDKAIVHYDNYLALVEDARGYIGLAEAWYVKDPESDRWMDILDQALECEDYHLTHSSAARRGASTLMQQGRFEDAYAWAELAAQSYSAWGLWSFVECLTGVGEFETAEQITMQITQRYHSDAWLEWCVCTGQGDLESAWAEKQHRMEQWTTSESAEWRIHHAIYAIATNDPAAAKDDLQALAANPPEDAPDAQQVWAELMTALLADRLGDEDLRDEWLQRVAENPSESPDRMAAAALARVFQEALQTGQLKDESIEQIAQEFAGSATAWDTTPGLMVGCFLWTRGEQDKAVEYLKEAARDHGCGWNRVVSSHWLREADVDPIHIEGRRFPDPFLEKQLELPEAKEEG